MRQVRSLLVALGMACLSALTGAGCGDELLEVYEVCLLTADPSPAAAFPGEVVTLTGGPLSVDFDTVIRVGGVDAALDLLSREGCAPCDNCRDDAGCGTCGECEDCEADCGVCTESVAFVVPDLPPGPTAIVVFNQHGTSAALPFEILGTSDTDDSDTADTDLDSDDSDTDLDSDDSDTDLDSDDSDTDLDSDDTDTDPPDSDTDDSDTDLDSDDSDSDSNDSDTDP